MRNKGQIHGKSKKLNEDLEKGWFIVDCKICNHGKFATVFSADFIVKFFLRKLFIDGTFKFIKKTDSFDW